MTRKATWERELGAYLAEVRTIPHAYGAHDCALFAAGAVRAMTGDDPASAFRGIYFTEIGAAKAIRRHGADDLEALIGGMFPSVAAGFVRRGDLVWHEGCVGVSMGTYALFVGQEGEAAGLVRVPRANWEKGWRVG